MLFFWNFDILYMRVKWSDSFSRCVEIRGFSARLYIIWTFCQDFYDFFNEKTIDDICVDFRVTLAPREKCNNNLTHSPSTAQSRRLIALFHRRSHLSPIVQVRRWPARGARYVTGFMIFVIEKKIHTYTNRYQPMVMENNVLCRLDSAE